MFGGDATKISSSNSGPTPYRRTPHRDPDAPTYSASCHMARETSVFPFTAPFTSTKSGFPTNGSRTSDQTAMSAPRSPLGDATTRSAPESLSASATSPSIERQCFAASSRSNLSMNSSALFPSRISAFGGLERSRFEFVGAESTWSRANPIASALSISVFSTRNWCKANGIGSALGEAIRTIRRPSAEAWPNSNSTQGELRSAVITPITRSACPSCFCISDAQSTPTSKSLGTSTRSPRSSSIALSTPKLAPAGAAMKHVLDNVVVVTIMITQ